MQAYEGLTPFFGDLHNHCGISYGHGSLGDALANAREQLDFCSVTGHAAWPDMPEPTESTRHIVDFHERGFRRLREVWPSAMAAIEDANEDGRFVAFPGFEVHSSVHGDRTIVLGQAIDRLPEGGSFEEWQDRLDDVRARAVDVLTFPHHIAYRRGQRGVNWSTFDSAREPVVEIVSMHGCSESDEPSRPYLHVMGPSDHASTMQAGLEAGHFFGVIGSTDHHAAHPGSYGHGRTGVWADGLTREAIWRAVHERRTYALTGDRIELRFALNGTPMGGELPFTRERAIEVDVLAGASIDYVDVIKNGRLVRRFSGYESRSEANGDPIRTLIPLELGWGPRGPRFDWDVSLGISEGRVIRVEPRFRGREVLDPETKAEGATFHESTCRRLDETHVKLRTVTRGNPNSQTNCTQAVCLHVEAPRSANVDAIINGQDVSLPLARLIAGARSGRMGDMESASYRFSRAPEPWEFDWTCRYEDRGDGSTDDVYYVRVRQENGQWAWSSPVRVGER